MPPTALRLLARALAALALTPASALAQDRIVVGPAPSDLPTIAPGTTKPPRPVPVPTPPPTPVVVSVGDSAISGEAGRWAGNTKIVTPPIADALGPDAYNDNGGAEATPGCHRSKSAEVHIAADGNGATVNSVNLACSGSKTGSYTEGSTGNFKPGLDFRNVGTQKGQAQLLQEYAQSHPKGSIKAVAV